MNLIVVESPKNAFLGLMVNVLCFKWVSIKIIMSNILIGGSYKIYKLFGFNGLF